MKIYNKGPVFLGILVFLALALFPFYNNYGKTNKKPDKATATGAAPRVAFDRRRTGVPREYATTDARPACQGNRVHQ